MTVRARTLRTPSLRTPSLRTACALAVAATALVAGACTPPPSAVATPPQCPTEFPVMGQHRVTANQMTAWFHSRNITGARPTVSVAELTRMYLAEGVAEGVAGDMAFIQAILETGWFRFPDAGQVRPWHNNFAGMGAVDGGNTPHEFPSARIGVRAQIQHLRFYADPTVTPENLANPIVTPRYHLVTPRGKAPMWEGFGNGVWATDPGYSAKLLTLYGQLLTHAGICP